MGDETEALFRDFERWFGEIPPGVREELMEFWDSPQGAELRAAEDHLDTLPHPVFEAFRPLPRRPRLHAPPPTLAGVLTYTHQDVCDGCLRTPGFCLCTPLKASDPLSVFPRGAP